MQFWQNVDSGKYFLLSNGRNTPCDARGQLFNKWNEQLSGKRGYQERVKMALQHEAHRPEVPSFLHSVRLKEYTPQMDKFDGYSQFRSPRARPSTESRQGPQSLM